MMFPWRGRVCGTTTKNREPCSARSLIRSSSGPPAIVSFARIRTVGTDQAPSSADDVEVDAGAPAGCFGRASSAGLKMPCTASGTPYSYGPPTTVGTASKLKIGGGGETWHSSVSQRHGLASARAPPRHEETML